MKQTDYQSYDQQDGFKPVQRVDATQALDRRNQRLQQGEQRFLAGLRQNTQVHVQNAARSGDDLKALAQFSGKLTDYLVKKEQAEMEQRIKEEDAAGEAAAYSDYMTGQFESDPTYDQATAEFDARTDAANAASNAILDDDGNNYPAVRQIREATGQYQMGYQRAKARIAALEFSGWMDNEIANIDMSGMNESEREVAVAGLRSQFMSQYGLSGINPQFLARELYPEMIQSMAKINGRVRKDAAIEDSVRVKHEAIATFTGDRDVNRFLTTMAATVDSNGKKLGFSGAWKAFNKEIVAQVKSGALDETDLKAIERQPIPGDPKGRTYGGLHESKFMQIRKDIAAVDRVDFNNSEADKRREFIELENEILASFEADPDGVTDDQIDEFQQRFVKTYGKRSSELDAYKKNNSVDAETKKKQEEMIENLIGAGLLTPLELKKFHPDLRKKYLSIAQQQQKLAQSSDNFKPQIEALKLAVKGKAGLTKESYGHPTVPLMEAKLEQEFRAKVVSLTRTGDPDPAGNALAIVLNDFNTQYSEAFYRQGFPGLIPNVDDALDAQEMASYEIQRINNQIKQFPDINNAPPLFTEDQVKDMSKGLGKAGFQLDPILDYVGARYGLSGLEILNRQRKAYKMDLLPPSPAIEAVQNELTPTQQRLLKEFPTPERSQRGLLGMSGFNPDILPSSAKPYADTIQQAAKQYGIPPAILTGLLETESSWDPNAVSRVGAKGLGQFMPDTAAEFGVNVNDPTSSINGTAKYLKYLQDYFKGDLKKAIIAYNGGMGNVERYGGAIPGNVENQEYYGKVLKAAGKYGYGQQSLNDPALIRPSSPVLAYISGNIGPTSTGQHLDVKEVGGGNFPEDALDQYVEVDDPEFGRVSLGEIRKRTGGVGDNQAQHRARGSHGIDYGLYSGTKVYVKNGAKVIGSRPSIHGDVVTIELPNGKQYTFLHGKKA